MNLKRSANIWAPVLVLIVLTGLTILNLNLQKTYIGPDDFAPRWTAARIWMQQGLLPYDEKVLAETRTIQQDHGFRADEFGEGRFVEPAFYVYFYLPFALLEFPLARAIWMTLTAVAYLASAVLALNLASARFKFLEAAAIVLLSLLIYPSWKLVLQASIVPVYICLLLLAAHLAFNGNSSGAAILLFICTGILPISIVVAIFLGIWRAQHRDTAFIGLYLAGNLFLVLSALILFPGWIGAWFANFIRLYPNLEWINTPLMRAAQVFPNGGRIIALILHGLLLLMVLVEWYGAFSRERRLVQWKLLLTLNVFYFFNLTSHGAYLLLTLPGLYMILRFFSEKWHLTGKIISWTIYLGLILAYWRRSTGLALSSGYEPSLIILLIPFITFLGLQWFRHWATVSPVARVDRNL